MGAFFVIWTGAASKTWTGRRYLYGIARALSLSSPTNLIEGDTRTRNKKQAAEMAAS